MKKLIPFVIGIGLLLFGSTFFVGCTRIEAGYVGIKVNLYGSERGLQDITEVEGMVWYNPMMTRVYEFPTFVQHKVWTLDQLEDSPTNEEFTVTTKDGLSVSFDVGLDYTVVRNRVPEIFRTYRKSLDQITNEFIRTLVRNAYNNTASTYAAEEMVSRRAEYEGKVRDKLVTDMQKAGFEISQVGIIGKIRLPPTIETAINAKIQAVQEAMRTENEKQRVVAEATKLVEQAKGIAESVRIQAESQAKANELLNKTLTSLLIQKMYIEKWDGKLPVYGTVPQMFKNVEK
jgi:regulator of protease activity HflC (stomatin/prohibitin superfamily)